MRKLLLAFAASLSILGCQLDEAPSTASSESGNLVSIAPRVVRTASISDSLYNATATVRATVLDADDQVVVDAEVAFDQGLLNLPGVQASREVKILIEGFNPARILLWSGTSSLRKAKDHQAAGVHASTDGSFGVPIFKRLVDLPGIDSTTNLDSVAQTRLFGSWKLVSTVLTTGGTSVQMTAYMNLYQDSLFEIHEEFRALGALSSYGAYYEAGGWAVKDGILVLVPLVAGSCTDISVADNCVYKGPGGPADDHPLFVEETATDPRGYALVQNEGSFTLTDIEDATNVQTWNATTN